MHSTAPAATATTVPVRHLPPLPTFGERLKAARSAEKISLIDLAEAVNKGRATNKIHFMQIRNAEIGIKTVFPLGAIDEIARRLRVDLAWLLAESSADDAKPSLFSDKNTSDKNTTSGEKRTPRALAARMPVEPGSSGEKLRAARLAKGMTQGQIMDIARRDSGLTMATVILSFLEHNRHAPWITTPMRRAVFAAAGIEADPTAPAPKIAHPTYKGTKPSTKTRKLPGSDGAPAVRQKPHQITIGSEERPGRAEKFPRTTGPITSIETEAEEGLFRIHAIRRGSGQTDTWELTPKLTKALLMSLVDDVAAYEDALGKIE